MRTLITVFVKDLVIVECNNNVHTVIATMGDDRTCHISDRALWKGATPTDSPAPCHTATCKPAAVDEGTSNTVSSRAKTLTKIRHWGGWQKPQ